MASFCLPKYAADALIKALPEDITKLTDISSLERRKFFEQFLGEENAKKTNALFESKLILKDQQTGLINWAKKLTGINKDAQRDMITKVERMKEILTPENQDLFLSDLAESRLGFGVTAGEAARIAELSKKITDTKGASDRMEYGRAVVEFSNYVKDLKRQAGELSLKESLKPSNLKDTAVKAAGQTKAIKASLDNSAVFRQGWKAFITNPKIWGDNAFKSFQYIAKTLGGKNALDEVHADIYSRPTYESMRKAKLDVGNIEEAFPTSLPERIPLFGRFYKASEVGFTGFIQKLRADLFDKYLDIAKEAGIDITDKVELQSIGKMVNSLTGRGTLGKLEPAASTINNVFFSPRFLKSHFDVLTAHQFQKGATPFVKKQAAINLVKIIAAQAAIIAIANSIQPGSAETDPRSSNFGKIRVGNTRFDVSGGSGSLATLAARLLTMSSKSATTGKVKSLNTGKFGDQTGTDVIYSFAENKLSPAASVVRDLLKGETFQGEKPTLASEAKNLLLPLPIQNPIDTYKNPKAANLLLIIIADGLGIGANTYGQ